MSIKGERGTRQKRPIHYTVTQQSISIATRLESFLVNANDDTSSPQLHNFATYFISKLTHSDDNMKATCFASLIAASLAAVDALPVVRNAEPRQVMGPSDGAPSLLSNPTANTQAVVPDQSAGAATPSLLTTAATVGAAAATGSTLTFKNSCPYDVLIKYKTGCPHTTDGAPCFGTQPAILTQNQQPVRLAPNGVTAAFDLATDSQLNNGQGLVFVGYLVQDPTDALAGKDFCPMDTRGGVCGGWGTQPINNSPQSWIGGDNPKYAAFCNPKNLGNSQTGCCQDKSPDFNNWAVVYDQTTSDCVNYDQHQVNILDMTWGTHFELTTASGATTFDSLDISTNFKLPGAGNVFFNIPVSITATASSAQPHNCWHSVAGQQQDVQFPYQCLTADCTNAYQTPTDAEQNGAQLQCNPGTSYTVEYCPGGNAF